MDDDALIAAVARGDDVALRETIMTKQAGFKRRVRARMAKTGESYATARRTLLAGHPGTAPDDSPLARCSASTRPGAASSGQRACS